MKRVVFLLVLLAACSDSNAPTITPTMQVVAGAEQISAVGRELPSVVEVRVQAEGSGVPLPDYPVNWTALDGGSVFTPFVMTGSDGVARQRWTLGPAAWVDPATGRERKRHRLVSRLLNPETGGILLDDTVVAVARPDTAVRFEVPSTQQVPVHPGIALIIHFWDAFDNYGAACPGGKSWTDLVWSSTDSSVVAPPILAERMAISVEGDSIPVWRYATLQAGTATLRVNGGCVPGDYQITVTVTAP